MLNIRLVRMTLQKFQNISFQIRVFILLLLISLILLFTLERYLTYNFERYLEGQVSEMAMNQAKIIASMNSIVNNVKNRDSEKLKQIVEKLSARSDFSYIVIGDEKSIHLYHPNPEKLGKEMQWNKEGALEKGESYIVTSEGSMGMALRAKTPIFDQDSNVIGIVSLGYFLTKINNWRMTYIISLMSFFGILLLALAFGSWWFSLHIKRQMIGMEPREIARVQRLQEALFGAVFEGLLAVDIKGNIIAINQNARKMLAIVQQPQEVIGHSIKEVVVPYDFFLDPNGQNVHDELCNFNGLNAIANRAGIWTDGIFQGWVVSFRSKDDIYTLSAQLSQIQQYVENLRTVRHEHLNWMATLGGLLQMKEYERALEMIKMESSTQQSIIDMIRETFKPQLIAALLFGKYHRAKELGLELLFTPGCQLNRLEISINENEFAAMLGNLLDNAYEAILKNPASDKKVELYLSDEGDEIVLEVADTGLGVAPDIRATLFNRGVSSKREKEHGIGLYLVTTYMNQSGGTIIVEENEPFGTRFSIFIPKSEERNENS